MAVISGHRADAAGSRPGGLEVACAVNAAWNALTYVCDPGLCLGVVSLGLVYNVPRKASSSSSWPCPGRRPLSGRPSRTG